MFPCAAWETWSQYLQACTHVLTHRGTGSTEKTKSEDVCGPSGSVHVSLEEREAGSGGPSCEGGRWGRELRRWETGGRASGHRLTVSAPGSALAGGSVHQKSCNTCKCCYRDVSQQHSVAWKWLVCMCVCVCVSVFAYCQSGRASVWRWTVGWCWAWRQELWSLCGSAGSASPPSPPCSRRNPADTLSRGLLQEWRIRHLTPCDPGNCHHVSHRYKTLNVRINKIKKQHLCKTKQQRPLKVITFLLIYFKSPSIHLHSGFVNVCGVTHMFINHEHNSVLLSGMNPFKYWVTTSPLTKSNPPWLWNPP